MIPTWGELLERIRMLCVYRYRHSAFRRWQRRRFARRHAAARCAGSQIARYGIDGPQGLDRANGAPIALQPGEKFEYVGDSAYVDQATGISFGIYELDRPAREQHAAAQRALEIQEQQLLQRAFEQAYMAKVDREIERRAAIGEPLAGYDHATKQFINKKGERVNQEDAMRAHLLANRAALMWTKIDDNPYNT